ncbi:hypothetical protein Tco_0632350 [Tanacetum coccineum]
MTSWYFASLVVMFPFTQPITHDIFEEMDLNAFIRTADPRKVRIVERARTENERPIVTVAKHRTVTLLPTSILRPSGELSDSVEREFGEDVGGSSDGGQDDASIGRLGHVEPIIPVTCDVFAETGSSRVKRSKKKRVVRESEYTSAASHLTKKLRADYRKTSGSAAGEHGVAALPTLPFITSSMIASPLKEGGDHTDFVTAPALCTVNPFERFMVLSDSSHHSSVKSVDVKVDSLIRSVAPVMTVATTVTTSVSAAATTIATPADVGKDENVLTPSVFDGSSSAEKTDCTLSLFTGRSGSGFVVGNIHAEGAADIGLQEIYVPGWSVTRGFELNDGRSCADMIDHFTLPTFFKIVLRMEYEQLFTEFNVFTACNLSLSSEVRMRAEYNILEKRKWKSLAEERNNLLQAKDKEIERLGSQLKDESDEVVRLRARVSSLEAIESSLQGEVASAKEYSGLLEQERNALNLKATSLESTIAEKDHKLSDLETSSSSLRVQNQSLVNQVHELEVSSAGLREKLETFEGSMRQLEYMEALGNAFGRAIKRGMHEADFNSAIQDLCGLDFSLLQELSTKKDASTVDVMNLLRLDNAVAEALGMTNLQPDVSWLMVLVCHKQDQAVIGSQALSVALDICHGRVEKMERNLTERLPFLKDVFVSIDHPLSVEALTLLPETLTEPPLAALTTTALSAVVALPSFDPSLSVEDYENPDLVGAVPKNVTSEQGSEEKVGGSTGGDANGGDFAFSELENEARDATL